MRRCSILTGRPIWLEIIPYMSALPVSNLNSTSLSMRKVISKLSDDQIKNINMHPDSKKEQLELFRAEDGTLGFVTTNRQCRNEMIRNTTTCTNILNHLIKSGDGSWPDRKNAVENGRLSDETLNYVARTTIPRDWCVREAVVKTGRLSNETLDHIARTTNPCDWLVREAANQIIRSYRN